MQMRESLIRVYKKLIADGDLLRLLYYKPENSMDDPLDPIKENVLDKPEGEKWAIIEDVVAKTKNLDGMDTEKKCRILMYLSSRRSSGGNYWVSDQDLVLDVVVHKDFDDEDFRMAWISDKVNEILFNNHVAGTGKLKFITGTPMSVPDGYVGYRLIYSFGSTN